MSIAAEVLPIRMRTVHNDVMVSEWQDLPGIYTVVQLKKWLGHDKLKVATSWSQVNGGLSLAIDAG